MKNLKTLLILVMTLSVITFQSCQDNDDKTARIQLKLVDAPGDYLEVNVEIVDVQYNINEGEAGWQSFSMPEGGYPEQVDLTELISGTSLMLTDDIIPAGMLKQIRLVLGENNTVLIEGDENQEPELKHLDTPSALQSGLKLNLNEKLEPGFTYAFVLDWNVQESVVEAGSTGMYNLKPVIKATAEARSGSVQGNVAEVIDEVQTAMENVVVEIYSGEVMVAETLTDANGDFLIQGLEEGAYQLKINQEGYTDYMEEINVTVGEVTSLSETIILTLVP
ncbi:DUF4382 domain-containing protein [Aestuariibaculum sediminum]|uniref:DUF4382 domain-containing protein n=1 Tax=Aestuariibaculum sediminum TaxID=2770637 RepID=A0A8J6Q1C7_9FLAO|nr:DUF4382 domain-containing protein [Aestuariibaculum sediminum]MBD0830891.1 DUF4382 domain-containing protein [Aestuariibaculum sediminum]